jgi:chemotaxis protein MotB
MSKQDQTPPPEIVIVRRKKGGEDDCHHGGVWKVAYADFMTAMMAFFLVMWLINAANEETRSQVASYFNPVKLVDSTTNPRGLEDSADTSSGDVVNKKLKNEARSKDGKGSGRAADDKKTHQEKKKGPAAHLSGGDIPENALFRDPVHTLDKIAGGAPDLLKGAARPASRQLALGAEGGDNFRDPFSPDSWEGLEKILPEKTADKTPQGGPDVLLGKGGLKKQTVVGKGRKNKRKHRNKNKRTAPPHAAKGALPGGETKSARNEKHKARGKVFREIKEGLLKAAAQGNAKKTPGVSIRKTSEGILISLTDKGNFGMFEVGSAKPRRETIRFMEKVAAILKDKPGVLIIRGHTDGRPFRTDLYDNWRLSTSRAHAARYMLLRGGIDDSRIVRIEGYADRKLAVPGDPLAARNRRIEILLAPGKDGKGTK